MKGAGSDKSFDAKRSNVVESIMQNEAVSMSLTDV